MKIRIVVDVEVLFKPNEVDGRYVTSYVDSDEVGQAVVSVIGTDIVKDSMIEAIEEKTNRRVSFFALAVPEVECIDYLS
jgi:hypothetical protein